MSVTYQVIYVDALGKEHVEWANVPNAEEALAYCKDPGNWPGHLIARKIITEDIYDTAKAGPP